MLKITLFVPFKICAKYSLNGVYAGLNYYERIKRANDIKRAFILAYKNETLKNKELRELANNARNSQNFIFKNPVKIRFEYCGTRLDLDNHSFIRKCMIDEMRALNIIKDDTKKYLTQISESFCDDEKNSGVVIKLES